MITITGLTKRQVALLDKMWAIDGYEEYMEWRSTQDKREIYTLEQLIMLAELDEVEDVSDAVSVLDRIRG